MIQLKELKALLPYLDLPDKEYAESGLVNITHLCPQKKEQYVRQHFHDYLQMIHELKTKQRNQMEFLLHYLDISIKNNALKDLQIRQLESSREDLLCQINQIKREMSPIIDIAEKMFT